MRIASADRIRSHAPLAVGRPCQRDQFPLASDTISDFNSIANSPDARIVGAHLTINADAAPLTQFQACVARETASLDERQWQDTTRSAS